MRKLLVLRGAPGTGKTHWVTKNKLLIFTLSHDNIRMMYHSPTQTIYGKEAPPPVNNPKADETFFSILEERMKGGEFTVIDGVNNKADTIRKYLALSNKYRYQMYIIDFTRVPIETAKYWNSNRMRRKRVREQMIDEVYQDFKNEILPDGLKTIHPDELHAFYESPIDLSSYRKIHHIGDIHAHYNLLEQAIAQNGHLNDDEFYIFLGDYTDKGFQNEEMLKFLLSIYHKPNVVLCEGNHEKWIWNWVNDLKEYPEGFKKHTLPQISSLDKASIWEMYSEMKEFFWYQYDRKYVFNSHGGIAKMPEHVDFISSFQLINGVGHRYDLSNIANTFDYHSTNNTYQVFGHRNPELLDIDSGKRSFFLDGGVGSGGKLRWLTLDADGFHTKKY